MNAYSQPVQTSRGPSLAPLTVGMLRSILKNIPTDFDSLTIYDAETGRMSVLADEDWLNPTIGLNPPGVTLKIR